MRKYAVAATMLSLTILPIGVRAAGNTAADPLNYAGWGVSLGLSSAPDQLVVGAHLQLGPLAPSVRLDPSVDIGFGDHLTLFTVNGDLTYRLAIENAGHLYMGGSLGLVYRNDTARSDGNLDMGAAAIVGYEFRTRHDPVFVEARVGLTEFEPDMKVKLGYTFLE
jgi:hypothetical protein